MAVVDRWWFCQPLTAGLYVCGCIIIYIGGDVSIVLIDITVRCIKKCA